MEVDGDDAFFERQNPDFEAKLRGKAGEVRESG